MCSKFMCLFLALKMLDLDRVASVVENPTMIRVALSCGRALCERALWLLLKTVWQDHCDLKRCEWIPHLSLYF